MKLADLRDHLNDQAADIDAIAAVPLEAVRRRATRIHRARVATAMVGTVAAVAVAAIGIGPSVLGIERSEPATPPTTTPTSGLTGAPDGLPRRVPPTDPRDYHRDDARFRYQIDGDLLRAAQISAAGETSVGFTIDIGKPDMTLRVFCTAAPGAKERMEVLVNGVRRRFADGCPVDAQSQIDGGSSSFPIPAGTTSVEARLVDDRGVPVADSTARVGVAAYATGAHRTIGETWVPELLEHNGYLYRLSKFEHRSARDNAALDVATPAGTPFLIAAGSSGNDTFAIDRDGTGTTSGRGGDLNDGGGISRLAVAARPAGRIGVYRIGPGPGTGELLIGLYLPEAGR